MQNLNFCSLTANLEKYFDFTKSCSNDLLTSIIHFLKTLFYYLMQPFSDQRTSSGCPYDEQPTSRGRPQDQFTDHHLTISDVGMLLGLGTPQSHPEPHKKRRNHDDGAEN